MDNASKKSKIVEFDEYAIKTDTIKIVFDTLPLEQKRKLALELLPMARIVHGMDIPLIEPRFTKWLCRGTRKTFTMELAERAWQLWLLFRQQTMDTTVNTAESDRIYNTRYDIYPRLEDDHDTTPRFQIPRDPEIFEREGYNCHDPVDTEAKIKVSTNREEYFDWLLDNTNPIMLWFEAKQDGKHCVFDDIDLSSKWYSLEYLTKKGWKPYKI